MGWTYTAVRFFRHRIRAKRWDAFHSPYLFRLFTHCCDETMVNKGYLPIEEYRNRLKKSGETIQRQDFGAGSAWSGPEKAKRIGVIARHALSKPFQGRFLSRLAEATQPKHIIEFGTSFGVTAAYLSTGAPLALVDTVEGDPEIASYAVAFFREQGYKNVCLHATTFESYIQESALPDRQVDLIFLDGNHTARALDTYYEALKPTFTPDTIIVVDDIYWSGDMHEGWLSLCQKPEITQSVDCFHFGILFMQSAFRDKEHHKVKLPLHMLRS